MDKYIFACYECGEDLEIKLENKTKFKDMTFYEGDRYRDSQRLTKFNGQEIECSKCKTKMRIELDQLPVYLLSVELVEDEN